MTAPPMPEAAGNPEPERRPEGPGRGRTKPIVPFYALVLGAMVLGLALGPALRGQAALLGEIGKLVITVIKAVATPLLFLSIVDSILKTAIELRAAGRMALLASVNTSIALAFGLLVSNVLRPGEQLANLATSKSAATAAAYADKKIDFVQTFVGYVPSDLVTPFASNAVISVVMLALALGFGLRRARAAQQAHGQTAYRSVEDGVATLLQVTQVVLGWVIKLVPLAVFGVAAKTVAEHGYAPLRGLAAYVGAGLLGLGLHVLVTYQLWVGLASRVTLGQFWRAAKVPLVYAMGTNSSLATLPITLRALGELRVSKSASTLGACVGTNLNNDGIVLYEGMAVLFVAQASGIHLSFGSQLLAAVASIVAAMGVAGVPEAGFVSLALVLNTVGLPVELLPLLLAVDWVLARARSMTNVLSDMVLSLLLDRANGAVKTAGP